MVNQRNYSIEYMRGISMLGVVGIHTGAYSLSNPGINEHLFALLEIVTRFSIPAFFFISAFGLFYTQSLTEAFDYKKFLIKRGRSVVVPYFVWSLLYMCHYAWAAGDPGIWESSAIYEYFLFGLASYQLYFLVILIWFYLLMPLWRLILHQIAGKPLPWLTLLLALQIAFNYYSSYVLAPDTGNLYLDRAIQFRMSFLVLHYAFIFILGAMCALHRRKLAILFRRHHRLILRSFCITLAGMLGFFYYLLYSRNFTLEAAVNTVHQLSPIGVLYAAASAIFWFSLFERSRLTTGLRRILRVLGAYSYPVYLVHPIIMYYLSDLILNLGWVMTVPVTLAFMAATVGISILFGRLVHGLARPFPLLGVLLLGLQPKKT
ncbi:MAG: acyltransferase [Negativicutes bacterium]|nr:acyltransferase [Negativicutes bacterium]